MPPAFIEPCLPIVATEPPAGTDWIHEVKHDGYRQQKVTCKSCARWVIATSASSATHRGRELVMPSIVSEEAGPIHFVLCDFGLAGRAYAETDPEAASTATIVEDMLDGQYDQPLKVIAVDLAD